jgi:hypothetical protein
MSELLRIVVESAGPATWAARLEGGPELGVFRQPFVEGARRLVQLGYSPELLVTMRNASSGNDSFLPAPLGRVADTSVAEGSRSARVVRYRPYGGRDSEAVED